MKGTKGDDGMKDHYEKLKELAKAERGLEVQNWVRISLCRYVDRVRETLFAYDLPVEVYRRREWVICWRAAKYRCLYPKSHIRHEHSYYHKKIGLVGDWDKELKTIVATKAQVTLQERKIKEYLLGQEDNIFFNEKDDKQLQKVMAKLEVKKQNLQGALDRMKILIDNQKAI